MRNERCTGFWDAAYAPLAAYAPDPIGGIDPPGGGKDDKPGGGIEDMPADVPGGAMLGDPPGHAAAS
jgi:hypothetical protein